MGAIVAGGLTGLLNQSSAQVIDGSLKFDSSKSNYLNRTPSSSGNRKTWTWSGWVQKTGIGTQSFIFSCLPSGSYFQSYFSADKLYLQANNPTFYVETTRVFRDLGWYHIVIVLNTPQTEPADRLRLYVNGEEASFGTDQRSSLTQNSDLRINDTESHSIGSQKPLQGVYANFNLSNVTFIDGLALGPGYFGFTDPLTGTWRPKKFRAEGTTINDGTVWSNSLTTNAGDNFDASGPKVDAFDGDSTDKCYTANNSDGTTQNTSYIQFNSPVVLNGDVEIYVDNGNAVFSVDSSGGLILLGKNSSGSDNQRVRLGYIQTSKLRVLMEGGSRPAIGAISVDGVIMQDSTTTNLDFGTNGFYLPMDGNSPAGEDKSGKGSNWTPVNFGGSVALDNPIVSGALPILNTDGGGNVARVGVRTDANAANLVLAASLSDTNTSFAYDVSNAVNSGSTTKTIVSGGVAANAAQSNFYGASSYFAGNGERLFTTSNSDLTFGTGDLTIEGWVYPTADNASKAVFSTNWGANGSILITYSHGLGGGAGVFGFFDHTFNAGAVKFTTSNAYPINNWYHVAFVRNGTSHKFYINGIVDGSATYTATDLTRDTFVFGAVYTNGTETFSGYMSDVRVYKGIAKYTSDFVLPATSPNILPDTPSGVSGSSKLVKVTDGAVSFDGSGDYLTSVESSDEYDFPSGDWTIEYFAYCNSEAGDAASFSNTKSFSSAYRSMLVEANSGNLRLLLSSDGSSSWTTVGSTTNDLSKWRHIALVRNSGTITFYVDGISRGSTSSTPYDNANNDTVYFGRNGGDGSGYFSGFISNARIVKGTALYTANFTPPSAPLTNVTNTKLLCCQSPSNVKLSPVAPTVGTTSNTRFNSNFETIPTTVNSLTVTNNGSVSTTSAGTNSFGFTNAADLTGGNSLSVNLGAIPQVTTIDIIFKVTGTTDNKYLFAISNTGLVRRTGSSLAWYNNSADQTISTTPDDGNWHHLRVTPSRLYFDGTEIVNTSATPNIFVSANGYMALGAYRNDSGTIQYNGAVDIGLVRVMPGVDLGAPSSIPITTNGTLSSTETIPSDGVIFAAGDVAATNFNPFTTDINAVRGQETGYCTMNPIGKTKSVYYTEDGNLTCGNNGVPSGSSGSRGYIPATIGMKTGKWYAECVTFRASDGDVDFAIGIFSQGSPGYYTNDGKTYSCRPDAKLFSPGGTAQSYGVAWADGDCIGIKVDLDSSTKTIQWLKNGIATGDPVTISTDHEFFFGYGSDGGGGSRSYSAKWNFGQKPFKFPPPAGFQLLNAANVRPETVITRPDQFVSTVLWTGNSTARSIVTNNAPDFVWTKLRNTGNNHKLFDSVRGIEKRLESSTTNGESTESGTVTSFNSDGFSLGTAGNVNGSYNYVAWCWKAGGSKNTFNIDDVGYASAADVNMSAGALNSSVYNTTQRWSSTYAGSAIDGSWPITQAFDGNRSTASRVSAIQTQMSVALTNITVVDKIEVCGEIGYITPNVSVTVGGVTHTIGGDPNTAVSGTSGTTSKTITGVSGALTNVTVGKVASGRTYLSQIIVDGKILVNDNITPPNLPSIAATGASVGTKQGFSIIKYQGTGANATIPHGLSQPLDFLVVKTLTNSSINWTVWHSSLAGTQYLTLNTQGAAEPLAAVWNSTVPTSSVISVGTDVGTNRDDDNYIAYCWHNVPGLQKFGSFEANQDADGPFIELGFRPAVVWIKNIDNYNPPYDWVIYDNARSTINPNDKFLSANLSNQENSGSGGTDNSRYVDFLSNGFKVRTASTAINLNAHTQIYCAWAEAPAFNLYGGQSNAR